MIQFTLDCHNNENAKSIRDKLCESLVGSKGFIDNEIIVSDPVNSSKVIEYDAKESDNIDDFRFIDIYVGCSNSEDNSKVIKLFSSISII